MFAVCGCYLMCLCGLFVVSHALLSGVVFVMCCLFCVWCACACCFSLRCLRVVRAMYYVVVYGLCVCVLCVCVGVSFNVCVWCRRVCV